MDTFISALAKTAYGREDNRVPGSSGMRNLSLNKHCQIAFQLP